MLFIALELRKTLKLRASKDHLNATNAGILKILIIIRFNLGLKIKVPKIR
jgi:hypothetical protein